MHKTYVREPEMQLIRSLVSIGDSVADVGANAGWYTAEFSSAVGPQGRVYSFEPVGENYAILVALLRKAHLDNVLPFRAALAAQPAEAEVVIPEMEGFLGYYWAHLAKPEDRGRRETIKVLTLDQLAKAGTIGRLDFVKCDVEGGELNVILGGQATIRSQKPGWLVEVSRDSSGPVFDLFQHEGYQAFVLNNGQLVEVKSYRDKEFSNYFFLHSRSACWERAQSHFC